MPRRDLEGVLGDTLMGGEGLPASAPSRLRVAIVSLAFEPHLETPEALLERYYTLVVWADALAEDRSVSVTVVQRFVQDAALRRGRVDYHFVADGAPALPHSSFWGRHVVEATLAPDPSIVHVEGMGFPALIRHLRFKLPRRTAIVVQDHGGTPPSFRGLRRKLFYRAGLGAADCFMFTAREQAAPWQKSGIIAASQPVYEVLEGSPDLATMPIDVHSRRRGRQLPGRPALLWVGRLNSNKDPLTVLRGFEKAAAFLPDSALTFVFSEDQLLREVEAQVNSTPLLRSRVHLRGKVDRHALPALYEDADVFVLASHYEGSGYALMEALSFGVTPVVTDIPSFRRITDGGRLGALFPPGDAQAFANALTSLRDRDFAAHRATVREHFAEALSRSAVGRRALEVYRAAASARAR